MNRLRGLLRRRLTRIGRGGVVGLGLLIICLAFYLSALRPTEAKLVQLQTNMVSLNEKIRNAAESLRNSQDTPAEQLVVYYKSFPSQTSAPDWLDKIYKAARNQNIPLEQGEYRTNREKAGKLVGYQVTLPVKGTYLQLRQFLAEVLADIPIASLDHISFERQKVGDEVIEAKIKLTLYLDQET